MRTRAVWLALIGTTMSVVGLTGCVGGGNAAPDGGVDAGSCKPCGDSCFDCGSGCFCTGLDASTSNGPWQVPFSNVGEPGTWRSTGEPSFCPGASSLDSVDLWSDERGVFVLLAGATAVTTLPATAPDAGGMDVPVGGAGGVAGSAGFGGGVAGVGGSTGNGCFGNCTGESIWFNDGLAGWQRINERRENNSFSARRLSGLPGSSPVLFGADMNGLASCSLGRFVGDTWVCDRTSGSGASAVSTFFGVSDTLGYAAVGNQLIRFDGERWNVFASPAPFDIQTLWADDSSVIALNPEGIVMQLRDGSWTTPLPDLRARSVWGRATDDVWFTDFGFGLWHFDGVEASTVEQIPSDPCFGDSAYWLWGSGDTLYVYGQHLIFRWDGSQFENLMTWDCGPGGSAIITRVWGNGPNEVFVLLRDFNRFAFDSCGDSAVIYFDGTTFHSL